MILHVTEAKYIDGYNVKVSFNNGRTGVANLADALYGPVFAPLKEKSYFSRLRVDDELETIAWPNGADLAPEYLYFRAFKDDPTLQEQFKKWGYIC